MYASQGLAGDHISMRITHYKVQSTSHSGVGSRF
jgi:hypothetical protein